MGSELHVEKGGSTHRPVRVTLVIVATLVLLCTPAGRAYIYNYNFCRLQPLHSSRIKLLLYETVYLGSTSVGGSVSVEADECLKTWNLRLSDLTVSNETSWRSDKTKWYEFVNCGNFTVKTGSKFVSKPSTLWSKCNSKHMKLSAKGNVHFGSKCTSQGKEVEQNKAACQARAREDRRWLEDNIDRFFEQKWYNGGKSRSGDKNIYHALGVSLADQPQGARGSETDKKDDFLNWMSATPASQPTYNVDDFKYFDSDTGLSRGRNYTENAIPIFIGIVVFTVTMCLRFCLCRGKSVVRRVTTVTVIRSCPAGSDAPQDQQDPPPSYIDVVNVGTSPQSPANEGDFEPPPPAYADIVNEALPPTYSEVEARSIPTTSEEGPSADQHDGDAHSTQPPPDPEPEPVSDTSDSAPSKNVLSKYISQQKQFAFKVLEDDE